MESTTEHAPRLDRGHASGWSASLEPDGLGWFDWRAWGAGAATVGYATTRALAVEASADELARLRARA